MHIMLSVIQAAMLKRIVARLATDPWIKPRQKIMLKQHTKIIHIYNFSFPKNVKISLEASISKHERNSRTP